MATYRKKPLEVEAVRWMGTNWSDVEAVFGNPRDVKRDGASTLLYVDTPDGRMRCAPGDWLVRGASAEYYPCGDDAFQETYDPV